MNKFLVGLDLGQVNDFTAIAVIERERRDRKNYYSVRDLRQCPLGTSYPDVVMQVQTLLNTHPLTPPSGMPVYLGVEGDRGVSGNTHLILDNTGVGVPVSDLFKEAGLRPICVTIHGGDSTTQDGHHYRVPKRDLIGAAQVALQTGRLKVAKSLPLAPVLVKELLNYRVKISQSGHDSYNAREGQHDDLVLAVAMAIWFGER